MCDGARKSRPHITRPEASVLLIDGPRCETCAEMETVHPRSTAIVRQRSQCAAEGTATTHCSSIRTQHSNPQQLHAGATVHLAFEELQTIDMSFGLAVAPRQRESCSHGSQIVLQASSEAAHLGGTAAGQALQPSVELSGTPPMHEPEELPGEAPHFSDDWLDPTEGLHEPLVIRMFGFVDRNLAPSHDPAERAPCRRARHRAHGRRARRRRALRR